MAFGIGGLVVPHIGTIRFFLAVCVMLLHLSGFNGVLFGLPLTLQFGLFGVFMFYVTSGFLVARMVERHGFANDIRGFAMNRLLRIYPAYWLIMIGSVVYLGREIDFWSVVLLFSNVPAASGTYEQWNPVIWTLDVELRFYLVVLVLLPVVRRVDLDTINPAWIAATLIGASLVVDVFAAVIAGGSLGQVAHLLTRGDGLLLTVCAPFFALGVILATRPDAFRTMLGLYAACALIYGGFQVYWNWGAFVLFTVTLAIFCGYVLLANPARPSQMDRFLGDMCYPLYLVHYTIVRPACRDGDGCDGESIAIIGASILMALIIAVALEQPVARLRRKLPTPGRAADQSASHPSSVQ